MLLGYNTNGLVHHRLDEAIELLHAEGFEAVALTPDVGHLDPFRASHAEVRAISAQLARLGMACVVETGARFALDPRRKHRPNLLEAEAAARARRLDHLQRCVELASELEARALCFWAGERPDEMAPDLAHAHLRTGIEQVLDRAVPLGVPLALEPEPGMLVETVEAGLGVLAALGDPPGLGLAVDIGHLYVTGEGPPAAVLPRAAGRIHQIHVEDMRRGVHEHLPPGEGDVDFPEVWRALSEIGYRGPVCFELSRSSHAAPDMLRRARESFHRRG